MGLMKTHWCLKTHLMLAHRKTSFTHKHSLTYMQTHTHMQTLARKMVDLLYLQGLAIDHTYFLICKHLKAYVNPKTTTPLHCVLARHKDSFFAASNKAHMILRWIFLKLHQNEMELWKHSCQPNIDGNL